MRRVAQLAALGLCFLAAADAYADDPCLLAADRASRLRSQNKLVDARSNLAQCSRSECPKSVQKECSQSMAEVLEMLPSVVPGAKDAKGRDLVDVKVLVDGHVSTDTLDGKALQIDPGVHVFRFETKGASAVEERVVVRQGEKNRPLTITFATPDDAKPPPPPKPPNADDTKADDQGPPTVAWVVTGAGVAALGVALYLDLSASSQARDLRANCAPDCDQSQVDAIRSRYVAAGVLAGLGVAAVATGIVLLVTHSHKAKASSGLIPDMVRTGIRF